MNPRAFVIAGGPPGTTPFINAAIDPCDPRMAVVLNAVHQRLYKMYPDLPPPQAGTNPQDVIQHVIAKVAAAGGVDFPGNKLPESGIAVDPTRATPEQLQTVLAMLKEVLDGMGDMEFNIKVSARAVSKLLDNIQLSS